MDLGKENKERDFMSISGDFQKWILKLCKYIISEAQQLLPTATPGISVKKNHSAQTIYDAPNVGRLLSTFSCYGLLSPAMFLQGSQQAFSHHLLPENLFG